MLKIVTAVAIIAAAAIHTASAGTINENVMGVSEGI